MADENHYWPAWDSDKGELHAGGGEFDEPTRSIPPVAPPGSAQAHLEQPQPEQPASEQTFTYDAFADEPTVRGVSPVSGGNDAGDVATDFLDGGVYALEEPPADAGRKFRSGLGKAMMVTGGVLGLLVLVYAIDLFANWGDVPRGVTVAGVDVGGMSRADAESKLRSELEPRFSEPVTIRAGDVTTTVDPAEAGLGVDWQATLEQAGTQPLSPVTRVTSFWDTREVGIVGKSDEEKLTESVAKLAESTLNHKKTEGDIKFQPIEGPAGAVKAVAVEPRQGQQLTSIGDAVDKIDNTWLHQNGVELDVKKQPVKATSGGVRATLEKLAEPAVARSILVKGDGVDAVLQPKAIGEAFEFSPQKDGSLKAKVDQEQLKKALKPQLASTEVEGRDAEIVFEGGKPAVKPSKDGRKIEWAKTLKPYLDVIKKSDDRVLTVSYAKKSPKVTTSQAKAYGIKEVIGEFTTGGFAQDSGVNIRTVAAEVNGAIVKPGDTFSLNGYTGPRTEAQGYVDAGIIQDGVPGRAVGGGISQFATTLFNASYFAGLKDAGHREHSYYISRYPMAREATVFQAAGGGGIDIAFTNDASSGIAIQTSWSPDSVTVKIWGTKRYRVESKTGSKSNIKKPGEKTMYSEKCQPSEGIDGFTVTDTRILYDINSGKEVRRESRTATYNPKPEIICKKREDD